MSKLDKRGKIEPGATKPVVYLDTIANFTLHKEQFCAAVKQHLENREFGVFVMTNVDVMWDTSSIDQHLTMGVLDELSPLLRCGANATRLRLAMTGCMIDVHQMDLFAYALRVRATKRSVFSLKICRARPSAGTIVRAGMRPVPLMGALDNREGLVAQTPPTSL